MGEKSLSLLETYTGLRDILENETGKSKMHIALGLFRIIFTLKNETELKIQFAEKFYEALKQLIPDSQNAESSLVSYVETSIMKCFYKVIGKDGNMTCVQLKLSRADMDTLTIGENSLLTLLESCQNVLVHLVEDHSSSNATKSGHNLQSCVICSNKKALKSIKKDKTSLSKQPLHCFPADNETRDVPCDYLDNTLYVTQHDDSLSPGEETEKPKGTAQPPVPRTEEIAPTKSKGKQDEQGPTGEDDTPEPKFEFLGVSLIFGTGESCLEGADGEDGAQRGESEPRGDRGQRCLKGKHDKQGPGEDGIPEPKFEFLGVSQIFGTAESCSEGADGEDGAQRGESEPRGDRGQRCLKPDMAPAESPKTGTENHHDDGQPNITKVTLLKVVAKAEDVVKKLSNETQRGLFGDLCRQVKVVVKNQEEEIEHLNGIPGMLALVEATWVCERHLARFVIEKESQRIQEYNFLAMNDYLKSNPKQNLLKKIKLLTNWTQEHRRDVNSKRKERRSIAHPDLTDLDLVELAIRQMQPGENQNRMVDLLNVLKMTASLMKFGRLAANVPPAERRSFAPNAFSVMISWNREFEKINGLQNIDHDEAKEHLMQYVNNRETKDQCVRIIDCIKNKNSKRLGKLAWELGSHEQGEALKILKDLLPNSDEEGNVTVPDKTVAKLHIPDFLPKRLWKDGIEIVEEYFEKESKFHDAKQQPHKTIDQFFEKSFESSDGVAEAVGPKNNNNRDQQHSSFLPQDSPTQQQCRNCGDTWPHNNNICPAKGRSCLNCGKLNHFAQVCRSDPFSRHTRNSTKIYPKFREKCRFTLKPTGKR